MSRRFFTGRQRLGLLLAAILMALCALLLAVRRPAPPAVDVIAPAAGVADTIVESDVGGRKANRGAKKRKRPISTPAPALPQRSPLDEPF